MSVFSWLLIPVTAYASLSPAPVASNSQVTPVLQENMAYEQQVIPIDQNALYASQNDETVSDTEISTTTLISQYMPKEMIPILNCESHFQQWNEKGQILTSSTSDVGIAQINVPTWGKKAEELGYDIYTTEGNLEMARYILDNAGIKSWSCYNIVNKS